MEVIFRILKLNWRWELNSLFNYLAQTKKELDRNFEFIVPWPKSTIKPSLATVKRESDLNKFITGFVYKLITKLYSILCVHRIYRNALLMCGIALLSGRDLQVFLHLGPDPASTGEGEIFFFFFSLTSVEAGSGPGGNTSAHCFPGVGKRQPV